MPSLPKRPAVPACAVVVPTRDRAPWLASALRDLAATAPLDVEVLVVDQSDPEHLALGAAVVGALDDPRFSHVAVTTRGLPDARNAGMAATVAPVVLFLDDDVRVMPGLVQAHLDRMADPRVGAVVGRIIERVVRPNAAATENRVATSGRVITNLSGHAARPIEALKGANMSLRRAAVDAIGGFDRNYKGTALLEDADVAERVRRAGFSVWFEPRAEVLHLSAPRGGVRQDDAVETERWRFHNTAYFVRRHRGLAAGPALWATFSVIAVRRAATWRRPDAIPRLMAALAEGWALGGGPPDLGSHAVAIGAGSSTTP